jgi:hypothetical protein
VKGGRRGVYTPLIYNAHKEGALEEKGGFGLLPLSRLVR